MKISLFLSLYINIDQNETSVRRDSSSNTIYIYTYLTLQIPTFNSHFSKLICSPMVFCFVVKFTQNIHKISFMANPREPSPEFFFCLDFVQIALAPLVFLDATEELFKPYLSRLKFLNVCIIVFSPHFLVDFGQHPPFSRKCPKSS